MLPDAEETSSHALPDLSTHKTVSQSERVIPEATEFGGSLEKIAGTHP